MTILIERTGRAGRHPGMGGSQRLTRLVGKAKEMDVILTGRLMGAEEAERAGLVARVLPADQPARRHAVRAARLSRAVGNR